MPATQVERSSLWVGCHAMYSMLATHNALAWMKRDGEEKKKTEEREKTATRLKAYAGLARGKG